MSVTSLPTEESEPSGSQFNVHLVNFEGPFDLLLQLISRHKMDITEVALSKVTVEFIAHIKAAGPEWDLEQTSQFVLVAATLLDLKAARLIPSGEIDDDEDLALLEARDLLFARLLQYRAFKQVAAFLGDTFETQGRRYPRTAGLEDEFTHLLPEVTIHVSPERFAQIAAKAMTPKQADVLSLAHLHTSTVTVREQAEVVVQRLRQHQALTFRTLAGDSPDLVTTVCRFLSLLELFREGAVAFEQLTPLGELTIRWTGSEDTELNISDEFDVPPGTDPEDGSDADGAEDVAGDDGAGADNADGDGADDTDGDGADDTDGDADVGADDVGAGDDGSGDDGSGADDDHDLGSGDPAADADPEDDPLRDTTANDDSRNEEDDR